MWKIISENDLAYFSLKKKIQFSSANTNNKLDDNIVQCFSISVDSSRNVKYIYMIFL